MGEFDIYVDSGNNIPDHLIKKHDITVIPYTCLVNGEERWCYEKDVPFEEIAKKYYDDLRNGADIKTSLIPKERIMEYVTPSLEKGRDVLLFTISSGISGTHNQALYAKEELEKKYAGLKVYVIDTANASMGSGLQALRAADLRDMGESAETCAKHAAESAYKYNSFLTVGDLKYLKKSGRISATLAIAGTLLNIKPVLTADGNTPAKITFFGKERGRKKALLSLAEAFSARAENPESQTVFIAHADCADDANELAEMLKERGAGEVVTEYYDLCTGSHVGPGTVAMFFYGTDRKNPAPAAQKKTFSKPAAQTI
ncbi:MAG: DegV family protein [Clostridia bacterium]|nr:DegV family protein [Clostridia bacterium]